MQLQKYFFIRFKWLPGQGSSKSLQKITGTCRFQENFHYYCTVFVRIKSKIQLTYSCIAMRVIKHLLSLYLLFMAITASCQHLVNTAKTSSAKTSILPGAYSVNEYLPKLKGAKVGLVANNTSIIKHTHLLDTLLALQVNVVKVFGPEHGFRGDSPDGKEISSGTDPKTGIDIISLYGSHKKPTKTDLQGIDMMVFDIQDVGVRFYTYISTLTYVMEACAENNIPLLVLDRPNPNGFYVDGPVLEPSYTSFIGLHPVPVVYGMTIGEYANMVNGEKWMKSTRNCDLTVVKCKNYDHKSRYQLPEKPSPNLQDMQAVYLYPSLCFFEGTVVSIGRGTENPFKVFGHPKYTGGSFSFTPRPISGISEDPPLKGQLCYGQYLGTSADKIKQQGKIDLSWLLKAYKNLGTKTDFFTAYFEKLAGTNMLRKQIVSGKSETEIRKSWQTGLNTFKQIRKKYLLYADFE